jgi:hypothetical protein
VHYDCGITYQNHSQVASSVLAQSMRRYVSTCAIDGYLRHEKNARVTVRSVVFFEHGFESSERRVLYMSKRRADRIAGTLVSLIDISMLLRVAAILLVITVSCASAAAQSKRERDQNALNSPCRNYRYSATCTTGCYGLFTPHAKWPDHDTNWNAGGKATHGA